MMNRAISDEEVAVIKAALACDTASPVMAVLSSELEHLAVVDRCSCGCDTVDFVQEAQGVGAELIADVIGTTPSGGTVGVIVWGKHKRITGLEIYDLGAGQNDLRLPVVESIREF